jgi:hypothetical protein
MEVMTLTDKIKVKLNFVIRKLLANNGIFINRSISVDTLQNFLKQVQPIQTNHELIRIGTDLDGGYLLPNDLSGIEVCFSPGVSVTSDFELEMANRGIKCFMADYSVEGPILTHQLFHFEKKFIGLENNDIYMTLNNWVSTKAPANNDMILQMDIEGGSMKLFWILLRKH